MKKILFILPALTSCSTFLRKSTPPSSNKGYFSQKKEGNSSTSLEGHPESPLNLSPETPAWEIALWIFGVIVVVCCAPAFCRFLCGVWPSFCERIRNGFKNLTKKKD
tara:strand:+ start:2535 stop:2855 length:321 start_codon:yes stop_codon:yes gene_type:complete